MFDFIFYLNLYEMNNFLCIANIIFNALLWHNNLFGWLMCGCFLRMLNIEGILISAAKVELFAWISWRTSGAQHSLWRLHFFLCKHFSLLLSLMILKMPWWHSRSDSFCCVVVSLLLGKVSSYILCLWNCQSTVYWRLYSCVGFARSTSVNIAYSF